MPIIQTNSGYGYVYRKEGKQRRKTPPFFKLIIAFFCMGICMICALFVSTKIPNLVGINTSKMFNKKNIYAISAGKFNDYSTASILSETILKQGGAGKIVKKNNEYFVLLSCYESEKDAQNVALNLKDSGVEANIYLMVLDDLSLNLDIENNKRSILKSSINSFFDNYKFLYELSINYDSKNLNKLECLEELNRQIEVVNNIYNDFNSEVCSLLNATGVYLKLYLSELIDSLTKLSNCKENFSGQIKLTYFKALELYMNFRQEIGN